MRLLIVTQSVDSEDFVPLIFFVRWLREFGKRCELVEVIAQRVGEHNLPKNVHVHSLGKEKRRGRMGQVLRFWLLQWRLRKGYDAVLVHMTPVWVILGAPLWLLFRKPVYLWYEARGTHLIVRLALLFVRKVFSASEGGLPVRTGRNVIVGHGIDTGFFSYGEGGRDARLILTVGRFTGAKRLDHIVRAFSRLPPEYRLRNIGALITRRDRETRRALDALISELDLQSRVSFETVSDEALRSLLQKATLLLHASDRTSLDKAVLQAMACGCLVVSSSPVVSPHLPPVCRATPDTMAAVAKKLLALPPADQERLRQQLRAIVERSHNLPQLVEKLVSGMSERGAQPFLHCIHPFP